MNKNKNLKPKVLYKYTTFDTGLKIQETQTIRFSNPKTFFASIKNFLDVERQLKSINEYLFKEFKPKYFVTTNYDDTLEKINSISYHITHINYISISGTQSGLQIFPRLTGPLSNSICFIILLSCGLTVYFICKFLFLISLNLHISGQSPL